MINKLRTRIKVIEIEKIDDGMGGFQEYTHLVKELFALVTELQGQRAWEFEKIYHSVPIEITIRSKIDVVEGQGSFSSAFNESFDSLGPLTPYIVSTDNLIEYKGKLYVVHSIESDQTNQYTKLILGRKWK